MDVIREGRGIVAEERRGVCGALSTGALAIILPPMSAVPGARQAQSVQHASVSRRADNSTEGDQMSENTMNAITGVRTVGVPVTDQARALDFYLDKLGFEKRLDIPLEEFGGRWIEVAPNGAAITIALVPTRDGVPTGIQTGIRLTTPDASVLHMELQAKGVNVSELLHWPGVPPMFAFRDQDGTGLEITEQI